MEKLLQLPSLMALANSIGLNGEFQLVDVHCSTLTFVIRIRKC